MSPLLPLALALLIAYPAGRLCARFGVPRVTGYLFTGIILGPSVLGRLGASLPAMLEPFYLSHDTTHSLSGVSQTAQALILFSIGSGLRADRFRSLQGRGLLLSGLEIGLTFLFAAIALLLVGGFLHMRMSIVLAAVAVATAPAATMMVLRELESEGPMTRRIVTLVGLDNIGSLLLFAVLFGSLYLGGPGHSLANLGKGALIGVSFGILLSAVFRQLPPGVAYSVLGLAGILATWGLAQWLGANPLLACMILGATLANACPFADVVSERLRLLDYPIYVAFFVLAGAELHLDLLIGLEVPDGVGTFTVLALSAAYVVGRTLGKLTAGPLAARIVGSRDKSFKRTGLALMAQAGLAIALADAAERAGVADGALIKAVILSSVTVFELIGPLCVRHVVVHAGEVKLVNLLPEHLRETLGAGLVDSVARLRRSLGLPAFWRHEGVEEIRAVDIMRQSFTPIRASMSFPEVIHIFAESNYDQYPVVTDDDAFLGVISFPDLRLILFDDALEEVVIAADLITGPGVTCEPGTTLPEIIRIFEECHGEFSYLPVVDRGGVPRVVGIIDQHGAMVAYRRHS